MVNSTPVLQNVAGNPVGGAHFDVTEDSTLIYLEGDVEDLLEVQRQIASIDRDEILSRFVEIKGSFTGDPQFSPDGKQIAITRQLDGNADVWILDLVRDTTTRLTFSEDLDVGPKWSSDGRMIYFA